MIAEYLLTLRTQGDACYEAKKQWCCKFLEDNLERIRVGLDVSELSFDDMYSNLLFEYSLWKGPLSKDVWESSVFASDFRAGLPEELDEAGILARFPPPNNGRATLVFENETVRIEGCSDFLFPASWCKLQHPEGGRVECDLEDAAALYTELTDRIGTLMNNMVRAVLLEKSSEFVEAHGPSGLPEDLRRDHLLRAIGNKLTEEDRELIKTRFVDSVFAHETYQTLRPAEKLFIRAHVSMVF